MMTRLLLRHDAEHGCRADLDTIRSAIHRKHPHLKTAICGARLTGWERIRHGNAALVSFLPYSGKPPIGGAVYCGRAMSKSEECRQLQDAGLPVPRWHLWSKGEPRPDLRHFGPYVVRKPDRGARGAEVKIVRTDRLVWKEIEVTYASLRSEPFFQEFVYTGPYPECHRIGTLFSEPIYSLKIRREAGTIPLSGRFDFTHADGIGSCNIVANSQHSTYSDSFDADVIELARQAHGAFPEIPLLGVDIIRDADTGKLWVIEVNASGYTWHFSSRVGRGIQAQHQLDFHAQFGGLERVAEILARRFQS